MYGLGNLKIISSYQSTKNTPHFLVGAGLLGANKLNQGLMNIDEQKMTEIAKLLDDSIAKLKELLPKKAKFQTNETGYNELASGFVDVIFNSSLMIRIVGDVIYKDINYDSDDGPSPKSRIANVAQWVNITLAEIHEDDLGYKHLDNNSIELSILEETEFITMINEQLRNHCDPFN